ncbi:response regulator [Salinicoccus sp. Marseille-QA3877]
MKVIIAEDDYRVSLIHEEIVNNVNGMSVSSKVLNGEELLKSLYEENADLILLDIYFPDIKGIDLLSKIRNIWPETDIIIVSASNNRQDLLTAKRFGVYQFLIKPVGVEEFTQVLNNYINDKNWFMENGDFNTIDTDYFLTGTANSENSTKHEILPSGIDSITLSKIIAAMDAKQEGITIEEICRNVGVSRTTARRYLEHLVSEDQAETHLSYGEIGRPERKYTLK